MYVFDLEQTDFSDPAVYEEIADLLNALSEKIKQAPVDIELLGINNLKAIFVAMYSGLAKQTIVFKNNMTKKES